MNIGPFGFPRLTKIGPLVSDFESLFSQPNIEQGQFDAVFDEVLEKNKIETPKDLTKSEKSRLAKSLGFQTYPDEDLVNRTKRARFFNCMKNKWARRWAKGVARETTVADLDDDSSMFKLRFKGCVSLTEGNVPDDPRLITQEDDDIEIEDAPQLPDEII